jgi:L-fuculose-phosphate aldolase
LAAAWSIACHPERVAIPERASVILSEPKDLLLPISRTDAERQILHACRRLYERGLIAGAEGNVSARIGPDVILATPAGVCKADIEVDDLVALSLDGTLLDAGARASTEIRMHLRIYQRRSDVNAVVHAHPPTATGFAVAGQDFVAPVLPELIFLIGPVPLVPYAQPGTDQLADALEPFIHDHDAFLLANHGATTVGRSLQDAQFRMESLEQGARILLAARQVGRINPLPADAVAALRSLREAARGQA